jgi:hypothetical protein
MTSDVSFTGVNISLNSKDGLQERKQTANRLHFTEPNLAATILCWPNTRYQKAARSSQCRKFKAYIKISTLDASILRLVRKCRQGIQSRKIFEVRIWTSIRKQTLKVALSSLATSVLIIGKNSGAGNFAENFI